MIFKEHKATVQQVLGLIPEGLLSTLALNTKVDYCAKVLQGERLFYLLMYAVLKTDRISQRYLEDVFKSTHFKFTFNYSVEMKVSHSSISEKLSKINLDFFKQAYEQIYERYNQLYTLREQELHNLVRVDSSMVAEAGTKLQKGMTVGCKNKRDQGKDRKQAKYTMAYDGQAVCSAKVFTEPSFLSEDIAMPPVLFELIKADKSHRNIYIFDRGLSSLDNFNELNQAQACFVGRIKTNRKMELVGTLKKADADLDLGSLELVSDNIVHLYDSDKKAFDTTAYRLIKAKRKVLLDTTPRKNKGKTKKVENEIYFITNNFTMPAKEIADIYKKRWDIEVFFRFIKQELCFKHFLSVNENGLQVMLYMTLITAMLLMVYKKLNDIGFVTAKRRLFIEMEDIILKMAVTLCGGDVNRLKLGEYCNMVPG